jgi:hypothetical protein
MKCQVTTCTRWITWIINGWNVNGQIVCDGCYTRITGKEAK